MYVYCTNKNKLEPYSDLYDTPMEAFNWWKDIRKGAWLRSHFNRELTLCEAKLVGKYKLKYTKL